MEYKTTTGKHGAIYHIATGVRVAVNPYGNWQLTIKHKGDREKKTFGKGEEELQRALRAAELVASKLGLLTPTSKEKDFETVAREWIEGNRHRWTPNTLERYTGILEHFLIPYLGRTPLRAVDRRKAKQVLVEIGQIRSAKTVELVHAVMSGIFSEAIDLGYTNENPVRGLLKKLLPPKHKRAQKAPDPFSKEDLGRLLSEARNRLADPLALILETLAYSGMRVGECLAMHCDHLDVRNCQYMVSETFRSGRYGLPKTGKRLIDLPASLVAKLNSHIVKLKGKALAEGTIAAYLFPGISQRMVQNAIKRACVSARMRARSPHDLRHTYASLLLMDHISPAYVQKQLGHHSITMTVDIYGHWIPGEGKRDLEKALRHSPETPGKTLGHINTPGASA